MLNDNEAIKRKLRWATDGARVPREAMIAATGVKSASSVSEWLRTGRIAKKHIPVLAKLTKTTERWWLDPDAPIPPSGAWLSSAIADMGTSRLSLGDATATVAVPMIAVTASMGRGEDQPPEDIISGTIAVSTDWIAQQLRVDPARLRFINGYGDSMSPTFNSGDVLLVDTGTNSVAVDGIYVLATDSRLFIKRVRERLDGRYEISSDNPLVKTVDELDGGRQVDVLGRVVWVWNGRKV